MNFTTLLEMINASEAREDDPDFQSPVDLMFERLMQPKMKAIQEKYKNDKQRLNMELANLYKQENVNPLLPAPHQSSYLLYIF